MRRLLVSILGVVSLAAGCGDSPSSASSEEPSSSAPVAVAGAETPEVLRLAYFDAWPTPNQAGQLDGSFAEAVGVPIEWIPMEDGGEMAEAMEAGEIDIAYSQGVVPFAIHVNDGADLRLIAIAVAYAEADNCVAQGQLGVTKDNAAEVLPGKTIMTPLGNVTHYKLLSMMEYLGVDVESVDIVEAHGGAETSAAFAAGEIDVGCAFGAPLVQMLDRGGNVIMTGAEQEKDVGISTYDIVAIPAGFGEMYPIVVTSFLRATQEFNDRWSVDPEATNPMIAEAAGMSDVGSFLSGDIWFTFPPIEVQLTDQWLGGFVQRHLQEQIAELVRLGEVEQSKVDFSRFIDTSYLQAIER